MPSIRTVLRTSSKPGARTITFLPLMHPMGCSCRSVEWQVGVHERGVSDERL